MVVVQRPLRVWASCRSERGGGRANETRTEVSKQIQSARDDCTGDARPHIALRDDGEQHGMPSVVDSKGNEVGSPLLLASFAVGIPTMGRIPMVASTRQVLQHLQIRLAMWINPTHWSGQVDGHGLSKDLIDWGWD